MSADEACFTADRKRTSAHCVPPPHAAKAPPIGAEASYFAQMILNRRGGCERSLLSEDMLRRLAILDKSLMGEAFSKTPPPMVETSSTGMKAHKSAAQRQSRIKSIPT
jgi:hypothetical protein